MAILMAGCHNNVCFDANKSQYTLPPGIFLITLLSYFYFNIFLYEIDLLFPMKDTVTKFLVSFTGQIEHILFPAGVFDERLYIQYDIVWGPDWDPISGLSMGTSQMACSGSDPERVVFNLPVDMTFGSTNVSGWPQVVVTVRAQNFVSGDSLRGYGLLQLPPTVGSHEVTSPLLRPRPATVLGQCIAWLTGRYPELADPKMLAHGKENYLLRTESYGSVKSRFTMISQELRKLGYDNQPAASVPATHD